MRSKTAIVVAITMILTCFMTSGRVSGYDSDRKFNMSYIYFSDTDYHIEKLSEAVGQLDEVAPSYFDLYPDGSLKLTDMYDRFFVDTVHTMGIKVVPFLSNHWDRELGRAALARREQLSTEIADAVRYYNLDGVNVDLENLTEEDRADYSDFVRLIREKLPSGCSLSVAVAANPNGVSTGWKGSYDYKALARYSDYLMVMAYDESYSGSPPGPVASYQFVEKSIKYAIGQAPAEKIMIGVPFYGRYWVNGAGGAGIGSVYVEELVEKYGGIVRFDTVSKSPVAAVTVPKGESFSIGHGNIGPGNYTIWYENEQSLKYKLGLVQKYNLKGTGSWSLGHEPDGTWDYYGLWLAGRYFEDIQSHWAQDSILSTYEKGWMIGTGNTRFSPDSFTTRAQAATVLVRMLGLEIEKGSDNWFEDTAGHWAQKEIEIARHYGIVEGTGKNRFSPDIAISREHMAVMFYRIFEMSDGETPHKYFNDVNSEELGESYIAIIRMAGAGVFDGFPDKSFRPYEKVTRAQMAVLLERIGGLLEQGTLQIIDTSL